MSAIDEIKERVSIEDVVSQYVQLKRAGRNFKGLSPFNSEKSPSFIVSPEKQIWHDFSSGKGGNVFSFVMEMEGLDFRGALEFLARQSGVDLSKYDSKSYKKDSQTKEKLYEVLEIATKFYQIYLSKNQAAQEYVFKKRGMDKPTALAFKIGYSPNSRSALSDYLKKKGFSDSNIKGAGLGIYRDGGMIDMFRGRIMIPLTDPTGRTIGFTARELQATQNSPKYINTPQTILYDKSRHIFGLDKAKEAIRKLNYAVVVEGNMDVISSYQAGVKQVVATAGTALTEYHLKGLNRFTSDIRLCFDKDQAGINATERSIPIASKVGVSLSMINIPEGKDPDELISVNVGLWQETIEKPIYAVDWLFEYYKTVIDLNSGQGKRQFSDIVLKVIRDISDPVEKDHYLSKVAKLIDVSKDALEAKLGSEKTEKVILREKQTKKPVNERTYDLSRYQNHFLGIILNLAELRILLSPMEKDMFVSLESKQLFEFLVSNPEITDLSSTPSDLQNIDDYIKVLLLQYDELYKIQSTTELHYEASLLQAQIIQQYVKQKKQVISEGLASADSHQAKILLSEAKELDKLLRNNKGLIND
ncbi:MAG: DNA primase [Candidatus Saccharibacteria bacterium]